MRSGLHRRHFLRCGCALAGVGAASLRDGAAWASAHAAGGCGLSPDEAFRKLKDGNAAYRSELAQCQVQGGARRVQIAVQQTPFCAVLCCSDSRVAPEIIFKTGLGELFIVRNAGNTLDAAALGSIDYAVGHLGVPIVLVMGHSRCGAVQAAVSVVEGNTRHPPAIEHMIEPILPAVLAARSRPGDLVENAVRGHVELLVGRLRVDAEPILAEPQKAGTLRVLGAAYSLDTGVVEFFDPA